VYKEKVIEGRAIIKDCDFFIALPANKKINLSLNIDG